MRFMDEKLICVCAGETVFLALCLWMPYLYWSRNSPLSSIYIYVYKWCSRMPGPSHKSRQLAWKYGRGAAWLVRPYAGYVSKLDITCAYMAECFFWRTDCMLSPMTQVVHACTLVGFRMFPQIKEIYQWSFHQLHITQFWGEVLWYHRICSCWNARRGRGVLLNHALPCPICPSVSGQEKIGPWTSMIPWFFCFPFKQFGIYNMDI